MGVLRVLAATAATCAVFAAPAAAGTFDPRLKVLGFGWPVTPGDEISVVGYHWFSLISPNCDGKIHLVLIDAAGKHHGMGRIGSPQSGTEFLISTEDEFYGDMAGRVTIPLGVAPGPARIKGIQRLRIKFPFLPCSQSVQLARKSGSARITIAGVIGNAPPQISELSVPPIRQGVPAQITWTQSEAGMSTAIRLEYEFVAGRWVHIGEIPNPATSAGQNSLAWDGLLYDHYLPPGSYRMTLQATGDAGELSAPARTNFSVAYG